MDQLSQTATAIPHIVQVYHTPPVTGSKIPNPQIIHIAHPSLPTSQGKVQYQQNITTESLNIPVSSHVDLQNQQIQMTHNQIVMSCQQTPLQTLHQPIETHMPLQNSDVGPSVQITSHVLLPPVPVFKHVLVNGVQQYYEYEPYQKENCPKLEPEVLINDKQIECKSEATNQLEIESHSKKRSRAQIPNPDKWACNVRKIKHQRGEAYVSRRGKFVPERKVRNTKDCLKSCRFKCNEKISDTDREHIFKAFYSLNANEKKHFLLCTTERNYINHKTNDLHHRRMYSYKYFFLVRAVKYTVCKNFYLGTLAISQKPVYNVHLGKSDMNIPKPDGRGLSEASTHSLPIEVKDRVRKHIMSFNTIESKPVKQFSKKKQYLDPSLSIKQMYTMYFNDCSKENVVPVKESMYRNILKHEFGLQFRKVKSDQQLCCRCKGVIKKKS